MRTLFQELNRTQKRFIESEDDIYTADFELAGFSKEDVSITADNQNIKIKAKKDDRNKEFSISLNDLVSPNDITSKMSNGLLTITMPKKQCEKSFAVKID